MEKQLPRELHAEITNPRHLLPNQGIEGIELLLEQTEVVVLSVDVPGRVSWNNSKAASSLSI